MEALGKNPQNYEGVKIDDFNHAEEKEIKERVGKRNIKRREFAENNKLLKKEKTRGR